MPRLMKVATSAAVRSFIVAALACGLLQGCGSVQGSALRPTAPDSATKSARAIAASLRPTTSTAAANFDELKAVVGFLRNDIMAAAEQKNGQSWNTGLTTLVGGSMATIGSIAKRNSLTNSGILLALLGLSSDQFYKPASTIDAHLDADSKLMCVEDAIFDITEADRVLAAGYDFDGSDEARKAVETLNGTINGAMLSYRRSLLGIRPGTPTRDEILGFIKRFAADEATKGTKGLPQQDQMQQAAAAKKFSGLTTTLHACVKLGVATTK